MAQLGLGHLCVISLAISLPGCHGVTAGSEPAAPGPAAPPRERCNGVDDDADGLADEDPCFALQWLDVDVHVRGRVSALALGGDDTVLAAGEVTSRSIFGHRLPGGHSTFVAGLGVGGTVLWLVRVADAGHPLVVGPTAGGFLVGAAVEERGAFHVAPGLAGGIDVDHGTYWAAFGSDGTPISAFSRPDVLWFGTTRGDAVVAVSNLVSRADVDRVPWDDTSTVTVVEAGARLLAARDMTTGVRPQVLGAFPGRPEQVRLLATTKRGGTSKPAILALGVDERGNLDEGTPFTTDSSVGAWDAMAASPDGWLLVSGQLSPGRPVTFGAGTAAERTLEATTTTESFLAAFDPDGAPAWVRRFSSEGRLQLGAFTPEGDAVVSCVFGGSADVEVGPDSSQRFQVSRLDQDEGLLLLRYDRAGVVRAFRLEEGHEFLVASLLLTPDGDLLLGGSLEGPAWIGAGQPTQLRLEGGAGPFIARYRL